MASSANSSRSAAEISERRQWEAAAVVLPKELK